MLVEWIDYALNRYLEQPGENNLGFALRCSCATQISGFQSQESVKVSNLERNQTPINGFILLNVYF